MTDFESFESENNPNDPFIGSISGGKVNEIPPDIEEFLQENGLIEKKYTCVLKRQPPSGSTIMEFLPGSWVDEYPSIEEIGKRFGPGKYYYFFKYHIKEFDPSKGAEVKRIKMNQFAVYLGTEWEDICTAHQAEKYLEDKQKLKKLKQKSKLKSAVYDLDDDDSKGSDPIETMKHTMGVLKDLGVPIGGSKGEGGGMDSMQMMMFMMNMMQKSSENMMQMMIASQQNTTNLMQGILTGRSQQQAPDTMQHFREMMTMVQGITEVKEIMNPEKRTVVDRIFEMAEGVMPAIMSIANRPPEQRANDPMVGMVKNMPEFQQMDKDPEMRAELIKKWDEAHGKENTDAIIATVGWGREDDEE
jgi:hypothetical protein